MPSVTAQLSAVVIGGGGVGLSLAARLAHHCPTALIFRRDEQAALIARSGIVAPSGESLSDPSDIVATTWRAPPAMTGNRLVFICVKPNTLDAVFEQLPPLLSTGESTVVLCGNGIGLFEKLRTHITTPCVRLATYWGAHRTGENAVACAGRFQAEGAYEMGNPPPQSALALLAAALEITGWRMSPTELEWRKAITNATVNTICTIVNEPNGILASRPELTRLATSVMLEIQSVAESAGFALEDVTPEAVLFRISNSNSNVNSTLQDLREGRPSDIWYTLDPILAAAEQHGIPCPILATLTTLLRALFGSSQS